MKLAAWAFIMGLYCLNVAQYYLLADAHRQARSAAAVAEQWKASSDAWRANSDGFERSGKVCLANNDKLLAALIGLNNAFEGKRK